MPKEEIAPPPPAKYRVVDNSLLDRGRRGKHYDLIQGIIRELKTAEDGSALEIPLDAVGGIGLANLRSAVHRGATAAGLEIETLADEKNFYVWKTRPIKAVGGR
jgi:hypothetical protein